MPDGSPRPALITAVHDLALRLLAGQALAQCHGAGWTIGPRAFTVDISVARALETGFRLVPAGDALPGFPASLSQTLLLEPLFSDNELMAKLRPAMRAAGGLSAYARKKGLVKSTVAMVQGCHNDMTPAVAATLGMVPHKSWKPARAAGGARSQ